MSLLARALQVEGIATTMTTWRDAVARLVNPPRVTFTRLPRGAPIGAPGDGTQQRRVLEATLALLTRPAPLPPVVLDETFAPAPSTPA